MGALARPRIANNRSTTTVRFMAGNRPGPPILRCLSRPWDRDTIKVPPAENRAVCDRELPLKNLSRDNFSIIYTQTYLFLINNYYNINNINKLYYLYKLINYIIRLFLYYIDIKIKKEIQDQRDFASRYRSPNFIFKSRQWNKFRYIASHRLDFNTFQRENTRFNFYRC